MDVLSLHRRVIWIVPTVVAMICLAVPLAVEGSAGLWAGLLGAAVGAVLSAALASLLWGFVALGLLIGLPPLAAMPGPGPDRPEPRRPNAPVRWMGRVRLANLMETDPR